MRLAPTLAAALVAFATATLDAAGRAEGPAMVPFDGVTFRMGSADADGEPNEHPAHDVTLGAYLLDRTEVTAGAYRACVARGACEAPASRARLCTVAHGPAEAPASCVSWQQADTYCRAVGKRLPTEAEWEHAARGGARGPWPWGDAKPTCERAVTLLGDHSGRSCSPGGPAPVGTHPEGATPHGVEDLTGNVAEWVADWYADHYLGGGGSAERGPAWGVAHVLRGGSFRSWPRDARVTARSWATSGEAGPGVGFRCARDAQLAATP